jgi:hypothetical protein
MSPPKGEHGSFCRKIRLSMFKSPGKKSSLWNSFLSFTHEVDYILTGFQKNGANGAQED